MKWAGSDASDLLQEPTPTGLAGQSALAHSLVGCAGHRPSSAHSGSRLSWGVGEFKKPQTGFRHHAQQVVRFDVAIGERRGENVCRSTASSALVANFLTSSGHSRKM